MTKRIYEKQPMSNMRRVLVLIEKGEWDRERMARLLDLDVQKVRSAINNLRHHKMIEVQRHRTGGRELGRMDSIYKVAGTQPTAKIKPLTSSVLAGVSFIFHAAQ